MSRTTLRAFLTDGGWKQWARSGSKSDGRRNGLRRWRDFHTEEGMWSRPEAEVLEEVGECPRYLFQSERGVVFVA